VSDIDKSKGENEAGKDFSVPRRRADIRGMQKERSQHEAFEWKHTTATAITMQQWMIFFFILSQEHTTKALRNTSRSR
jgi:hypothetical protein